MSGRLVVLDASYGDLTVETEAAAPFGVAIDDARFTAREAIADVAASADGVLVQYLPIDAATIERCPGWKVIGRYGVGVDNVDLEAASRRGIAVVNVPDYCVEEVATHTAALVLAAHRRLAQARAQIAAGDWENWPALRPVQPLSHCTLGIVGVGRIGAEVVRLLGPFFGRIVCHDPVLGPPPGTEAIGLDDLFAAADVVSLHCPLTPRTQNLVGAARLATMKPGSLLVNVSRGGLVDTAALVTALQTGRPGAAALDVLPQEPPTGDDPVLTAPNLLLTNHVAWYSEVALVTLRRLLAERCAGYLAGRPVATIVNADALAAANAS